MLRTIVAGSIFVAGFNLLAPNVPEVTHCMPKPKKSKRKIKDLPAAGPKGLKHGKGKLVLDFSDPVDEAFDLVSVFII